MASEQTPPRQFNMKLVGICRVSTHMQLQEGSVSFERQEHSIKRTASYLGVPEDNIRWVYLRDVSGSDVRHTPEWRNTVRPALREDNTHLVVDAIDRLIRLENFDFGILEEIRNSNTKLFVDGQEYNLNESNTQIVTMLNSWAAGLERVTIKRRFKRAKDEKRRLGKFPNSHICLSTGIVFDRQTGTWRTNEEIHLVRKAFRLFGDEGIVSFTEIAEQCGNITPQTIRNWFTNEIYRGVMNYRFERDTSSESISIDGKRKDKKKVLRRDEEVITQRVFLPGEEPICPELWAKVNSKVLSLKEIRRGRRSKNRSNLIYSSFMYSYEAERLIDLEMPNGFFDLDLTQTVPENNHIIYGKSSSKKVGHYVCRCKLHDTSSHAPKTMCDLKRMRLDDVNQALDQYLTIVISDELLTNIFESFLVEDEGRDALIQVKLNNLKAELKSKMQGRDRLVQLHVDGVIERSVYDARRHQMLVEIDRIEREILKIDQQQVKPSISEMKHYIFETEFNASLGHQDKVNWLRKYVKRIFVSNKGVEGIDLYHSNPIEYGYYSFVSIRHRDEETGQLETGYSWEELLGYSLGDHQARRQVRSGLYSLSLASEYLGLKPTQLSYRVRSGTLKPPMNKIGRHKVWTLEELEEAKRDLEAINDADQRWGVKKPQDDRWKRGHVAKALGVSVERVRYMESQGKIPLATRAENGHRFWTEEQVAVMVENQTG